MQSNCFYIRGLSFFAVSASIVTHAQAASKQAPANSQAFSDSAQRTQKREMQSGRVYAQAAGSSNIEAPVYSSPSSQQAALKYSITTTFPGGGSQPIANAIGLRRMLDTQKAISVSLLFSNNTSNEKDKSIFGLSGKFQYFMGADSARARAYGFGGAYIWKPSGDANKPNDNTAFGISGGIGAEVYFIPEFSSFVETGIFIDASNKDKSETEFGTFASAIGLSYNFNM